MASWLRTAVSEQKQPNVMTVVRPWVRKPLSLSVSFLVLIMIFKISVWVSVCVFHAYTCAVPITARRGHQILLELVSHHVRACWELHLGPLPL